MEGGRKCTLRLDIEVPSRKRVTWWGIPFTPDLRIIRDGRPDSTHKSKD